MKITFLLIALVCFRLAHSQTLPNFEEISLKEKSDYKPAEPTVLTAANYIFATPVKADNLDWKSAFALVIKWMMGTPDFNFELDQTIEKVSKGSEEILLLCTVAMAKYAIENPGNAKDKQLLEDKALEMVISYCRKPENNLKMTKGLKKYAEEKAKQQ